jgi:hypothetical protein
VERTLHNVLADPRYSFCSDSHRPIGEEDFYLCRFAGEAAADCPAFAKACREAAPQKDDDGFTWRVPSGSALASVLFWVLVGAIVVWCVSRIAKNFQGGHAEGALPQASPARARGSEAVVEREEISEKDPSKLFAGARDALSRGDESAAARLGHAALVRALEREGHLTVDKSATNGDYARALRGIPDARAVFRAAAMEVEQSEFGVQRPSAERVSQLLGRIRPVVERAVAVGSVLLAFLSASCSSLSGLPEDAPGGDSILRELLTRRGATYARRTKPLVELADEKTDVVIIDPSASLEPDDWSYVGTWLDDGGTLVFVGIPSNLPKEYGIHGHGMEICHEPTSVVLDAGGKAQIVGAPLSLRLSEGWETVVSCGGAPIVAHLHIAHGDLYVFGDDDFLRNASLSRRDHARLLFSLLGHPRAVSLVDRWIAAGAGNPYRAMANSGLLPVLGHGLFWMLLWALSTGIAFGARKQLAEAPRTAFSEHVRALGTLYARAHGTRHALSSYAGWALDRLGARFRSGSTRLLDLASAVAAATGRPEARVAAVLTEAYQAREDHDAIVNDPNDLITLAALDDLMQEAGGHQ